MDECGSAKDRRIRDLERQLQAKDSTRNSFVYSNQEQLRVKDQQLKEKKEVANAEKATIREG
ncbi:hypothetical protein PR003_g4756 [Phytophthora rubi]|uniref:Uncharacterized protein n=1 Tax=Phytophthora rubi TaxID=129364 RepID=A0A6A4FU97_9STRA|nr:hypothetical protein PR001_g4830 [Phytophthora rubi]KAE9351717.1 hypothetical protein PR003_g4756 [Phytophthora rubi]